MPLEPLAITVAELFTRLAGGHAARVTVVTPNRRLAQSLQRDYDAARQRAGELSWETPDVLPFDAFVQRLWEDALYSPVAGEVPLLLDAAQEQALWEDAIASTRHAEGMLSPSAAAGQCRDAWALVHGWRLAGRLARFEAGEDARAFLEWTGRYTRLTRERRMTDAARLPDVVVPLLPVEGVRRPAALVLFGFDIVTPQQSAFLEALKAHGTALFSSRHEAKMAAASRREFATADEELVEIARWARTRLEAAPGARVGIVVPDLAQSRARVARALERVLQPARRVERSTAAAPFDISLGVPLDTWPLVGDALQLLRLCGREVRYEDASRVLRSPFIAGADAEMALRARADAAMRERAAVSISLEGVLRVAAGGGVPRAPRLLDLLAVLAEYRKAALFGAHTAAEWARAFSEALRLAGFPGERTLDSAEFQALQKWHQLLAAFASLERVTGRMRHAEACGRLERMARETLFQPESGGGPIQVLGILESAGLAFDHLWVCGLSDDAWPMAPRPNPLVPAALQRQAGVPHADAALSLALDRRITAGWLQAAGEVVMSHARSQDDAEAAASPLVAHLPLADAASLAIAPHPLLHQAMLGAGRLERLSDARASALEPGTQGGGTGLFKDQAACPFRAFAKRRLDSRELAAPQPGLDRRDRGTLLHEMMRGTWERLGSRARLVSLEPGALDVLLGESADEAIGKLRCRRAEVLTERFAALERVRLAATTREWLDFEATRRDFEVVRKEEKKPVTFGGVTVNTRIDRVDQLLADGGLAVLDYKTGDASVGAWLGARTDDPQLPMYALASGEDVRAIAFARVRPGDPQFCGLAVAEGLLPKVRPIDKNRSQGAKGFTDWAQLKAHWQREIDALGREFREGDARVSPKNRKIACEQCEQHAFCRVAEKSPRLAADDEDSAP